MSIDSGQEVLTTSKLKSLREKWSSPDRNLGWEFDGVEANTEHWMGYNHEMSEGLSVFGCKTFDELTLRIEKKLGRKPNVIDLMGGAYFLHSPENTSSLVGIRIQNKDQDFLEESNNKDNQESRLLSKIIKYTNRKIIEADILSNIGWNKIKESKVPLADLLVCRPVGPFDNRTAMGSEFDNPESYAGLYSSLFKRMISMVNRDGGIIFTEVPDIYSNDQIKKFFKDTDVSEGTDSFLFEVKDEDYSWGGKKRRYAVVQFKKIRSKS